MFPCSFRLKVKTKRRAGKVLKMCRAPKLFTLTEFGFSLSKFEKSLLVCFRILSFLFVKNSFSYKQNTATRKIQRQEKYSDKKNTTTKFTKRLSACIKLRMLARNFALKMPKLLQPFPSISMFFLDKR